MQTAPPNGETLNVSREKLLSFVSQIFGASGNPNPDDPHEPGPYDPVIRAALESINIFSPHSAIWKLIFEFIVASHPEISDAVIVHRFGAVALNPQPLPPRVAFVKALAQALINRAGLMQEIADAARREGEQSIIINVGGYVSRFVDDHCGTDAKLKYPFPGPRPRWFPAELAGIDLVVMAAQFEQAARETFSRDLRDSFAGAAVRLAETGFSRIQ